MNLDPEMFGAAMGRLVRDATEPLAKRIEQLEKNAALVATADQLDLIEDLQGQLDQLKRNLEAKP